MTKIATDMPAMLAVAAMIVVEHPADDQMAFLVCLLARLAQLNKDNPLMATDYSTEGNNITVAVSFLNAVKAKIDALPQTALNDDEESSECQGH